MRLGMVIEAHACVGCEACSVACKIQNGSPPNIWLSWVAEREEGKFPHVSRVYTPMLCFHCTNPPCVKVCPTKALSKRSDGIVVADQTRCAGVRACMAACPYGALQLYRDEKSNYGGPLTDFEKYMYAKNRRGTVMKCNFCAERVEKGLLPACVEVCPTRCRFFGDFDDPASEVSKLIKRGHAIQLYPEFGTSPSVYYVY